MTIEDVERYLRTQLDQCIGVEKIERFTTLTYFAEGYIRSREELFDESPLPFTDVMNLLMTLGDEYNLEH